MVMRQLTLPINSSEQTELPIKYPERLVALLERDLDFHSQDSGYASHNLHSFPAKFPPQLPHRFITALTAPGEVVLDPMVGSGTTVLEALLVGRQGIGFDIDPLALLISRVKSTPLDLERVVEVGNGVLKRATLAVQERKQELVKTLENQRNSRTRNFLDYWFTPETQIELQALVLEIENIPDLAIRAFFELTYSAIIITKSSSVSLALDIAHTRPHRAKVILDENGDVISGKDVMKQAPSRLKYVTKTLRSPLEEFQKQFKKGINNLLDSAPKQVSPWVLFGDAQRLPICDNSVDLIVTSPPYPANAIDYMRAHKFSLVWMGYPIVNLGRKRKEYIGGEAVTGVDFEVLPVETASVVTDIASRDDKKGQVLHRYYSEMTKVLREMFRVLKPNKSAIVVVGSSTMRGQDTRTPECLVDIGRTIGFEVPRIGVRNLDRDRRMMPTGSQPDLQSQIQQRMHQEYVIGFYKPVD